jgi:hypothetical protein
VVAAAATIGGIFSRVIPPSRRSHQPKLTQESSSLVAGRKSRSNAKNNILEKG